MRVLQLLRHKLLGGPPPPPATKTDPDIEALHDYQHRVFNRAQRLIGEDWRNSLTALKAEGDLTRQTERDEP